MPINPNDYRGKIIGLCVKKGWRVKKRLAAQIGITPYGLAKILNGAGAPNLKTYFKMKELLGPELEEIMKQSPAIEGDDLEQS